MNLPISAYSYSIFRISKFSVQPYLLYPYRKQNRVSKRLHNVMNLGIMRCVCDMATCVELLQTCINFTMFYHIAFPVIYVYGFWKVMASLLISNVASGAGGVQLIICSIWKHLFVKLSSRKNI